jgi:hypothetical protein
MSATGRNGNTSANVMNSYTGAYQRELGSRGISTREVAGESNKFLMYPVIHKRNISRRQAYKRQRARLYASTKALVHRDVLSTSSVAFVARSTPIVGDLIDCTLHGSTYFKGRAPNKTQISPTLALE